MMKSTILHPIFRLNVIKHVLKYNLIYLYKFNYFCSNFPVEKLNKNMFTIYNRTRKTFDLSVSIEKNNIRKYVFFWYYNNICIIKEINFNFVIINGVFSIPVCIYAFVLTYQKNCIFVILLYKISTDWQSYIVRYDTK